MTRYSAFLRAINVGGRTAKSAALCAPFEALGFTNVSTFLASGNVVFDTDSRAKPASLESKIEDTLQQAFGWEIGTFLRTGADLEAVLAKGESKSLAPGDGETLHVMFLRDAPTAAVKKAVAALSNRDDVLEVYGRELLWLRRGKLMESTLPPNALGKAIGKDATMRNTNTLRRMVAKYFG